MWIGREATLSSYRKAIDFVDVKDLHFLPVLCASQGSDSEKGVAGDSARQEIFLCTLFTLSLIVSAEGMTLCIKD